LYNLFVGLRQEFTDRLTLAGPVSISFGFEFRYFELKIVCDLLFRH